MSDPGPPKLKVTGLSLDRFDAEKQHRYKLTVPHFEVGQNERIGLVGESGSGKSTFLEMLGLLAWPDTLTSYTFAPDKTGGAMEFADLIHAKDTETLTQLRARLIGFVPQDGGLIPYLNVRENAQLAAELSAGLTAEALTRIKTLATNMGIGGYLDNLPSALSGGQRQRAAVLRALAPGTTVLLGDEPTASLDARTAVDVMQVMMDSAAQTGATLIIASHQVDLLEQFGFRICEVKLTGPEGDRRATLDSRVAA